MKKTHFVYLFFSFLIAGFVQVPSISWAQDTVAPPELDQGAPPHHFKNSKKIIQDNLRNAREHYNNDETIARTEDRMLEKIDEIIVRVVISAVVGTGVAEVVVEGNRIYILVTQKSSNTQLSRSLWSKSLLFLANNLTEIMVSFFKKMYIPL